MHHNKYQHLYSLRNLFSTLTINVFQLIMSEHQGDQSCPSVQAELWCPLQVVIGKIKMFELTERLKTKIYIMLLPHFTGKTNYIIQIKIYTKNRSLPSEIQHIAGSCYGLNPMTSEYSTNSEKKFNVIIMGQYKNIKEHSILNQIAKYV